MTGPPWFGSWGGRGLDIRVSRYPLDVTEDRTARQSPKVCEVAVQIVADSCNVELYWELEDLRKLRRNALGPPLLRQPAFNVRALNVFSNKPNVSMFRPTAPLSGGLLW